jgi:hypothetical protein
MGTTSSVQKATGSPTACQYQPSLIFLSPTPGGRNPRLLPTNPRLRSSRTRVPLPTEHPLRKAKGRFRISAVTTTSRGSGHLADRDRECRSGRFARVSRACRRGQRITLADRPFRSSRVHRPRPLDPGGCGRRSATPVRRGRVLLSKHALAAKRIPASDPLAVCFPCTDGSRPFVASAPLALDTVLLAAARAAARLPWGISPGLAAGDVQRQRRGSLGS